MSGPPDTILRFWFDQTKPVQWFRRDPNFDAQIQNRFSDQVEAALAGQLDHWSRPPYRDWRSCCCWTNSRAISGETRPRLSPEINRLCT